ncbi:MAG TPA: hypothetical protein VFD64_04550 [Gemmatimonadaceae bacterium]|nr:hypothetical protein [Gemmatimonadaceae bacterium]
MKVRLALGIVAATAATLFTVSTTQADPNLGNIPPHRHYVSTPNGVVEVGPRICGNPQLQKAFNQFHNNIHAASSAAIGPVAPGLHNFKGAELLAGGC